LYVRLIHKCNQLEDLDEEEEAEELRKTGEHCIKAFLLFLVGVTIFANKINKHVHMIWLMGMKDIDRVHMWSLDGMTLAYLYAQLSEATNLATGSMAGYMSLHKVVIFFYIIL